MTGQPVELGDQLAVLAAEHVDHASRTAVNGGQSERQRDGVGANGGDDGVVGASDQLEFVESLESSTQRGLVEFPRLAALTTATTLR